MIRFLRKEERGKGEGDVGVPNSVSEGKDSTSCDKG